jgi:hypothetical protein
MLCPFLTLDGARGYAQRYVLLIFKLNLVCPEVYNRHDEHAGHSNPSRRCIRARL